MTDPISLAVLIFFFLLALRRPVWALAGTIAVLPAYQLRRPLFGFPSTILEAAVIGTLAGWFLHLWLRTDGEGWARHWRRLTDRVPAMLAVFIGISAAGWVLSTFVSVDRAASFGALKSWFFEPLLLAALWLMEWRGGRERNIVERAFLIVLTWVSVVGLWQFFFIPAAIEGGRLSSVFTPVANYYAMFAAPIIVYAVGLFFLRRHRPLVNISLLTSLPALALSYSFGGYLAVAAGLLVLTMIFLHLAQRRIMITCLTVGLLVVSVAALTTGRLQEKLNFDTRSSSLVRLQIWRTAWEIGRRHPGLGIGPGTFEQEYRKVAPEIYHPPLEWLVAKPHNLFLNLWVETGLLGLLGMLGVFFVALRRSFKPAQEREVMLAATGLVAILVHGLVDTSFFKNDLAVLTALFLCLSMPRKQTDLSA